MKFWSAIFSFFFISSMNVFASVDVQVSIEQLVKSADTIVVAHVVHKSSYWETTSTGKRIVTHATLNVDQWIEGTSPSSFQVRVLGGSVGDVGQYVSGEPTLAMGEPIFLFLRKFQNLYQVVSRSQGEFYFETIEGVTFLRSSPNAAIKIPQTSCEQTLTGKSIEKAVFLIHSLQHE